MKMRTLFVCEDCGHSESKWFGKCPQCEQWNTAVEEVQSQGPSPSRRSHREQPSPTPLSEIQLGDERRLNTGFSEIDRVLGGGIIPGSAVLVGGEPGMGKSTLMLQLSCAVSRAHGRILYVTAEESKRQTKMRAVRMGLDEPEVHILSETDLTGILEQADRLHPFLMVVDSIQGVSSNDVGSVPGSISQVRECSNRLVRFAKHTEVPVFLVGHVTKQGVIAGPRVLEHLVDTVLYMEGDRHHAYRLLRAVKNRFGSTDEIGVFEMRSDGLAEVNNPSSAFLQDSHQGSHSGSVVTATMEGTRPLLLEIQALCSDPISGGAARRTTSGIDTNRVAMFLAVLEKRAGLPLTRQDVYLNIVGGVKVAEPAVDLAAATAVASSVLDRDISSKTFVFGEVGLAGEVRPVNLSEKRLLEGKNLGFQCCVLPERNAREIIAAAGKQVQLCPVRNIMEALQILDLL